MMIDGGNVSSVFLAIDTAFTPAAASNPTSYGGASQLRASAWGINQTNGGHFCVIGGGLQVVSDGVQVGGVGDSMSTAAQDEVAEAAVDRFAASLDGLAPGV